MRPAPLVSFSPRQVLGETSNVIEMLPIATCICDRDGIIVQYNRRALEVWGRTPQPGELHDQFTATTRFYDAQGRRLQEAPIRHVLRTGEAVRDREISIERGDRRRVMLFNIDPLYDGDGGVVGVTNCFQDITESKRLYEALDRSQQDLRLQEQRWGATYEHASIGIVEIDRDGQFLRVNESICSITGMSRDDLLHLRLFDRTHPDDRDEDRALFQWQVSGEIAFYALEKRFVRKDGSVIWCSIRSSTVHDADGKFLYAVRVLQDVTERRRAEERQKLLIDELNHRVKNTLATVQSLASQTALGAASPEVFRTAFEGRLIALSHAHDQLTQRHWANADLRGILESITEPHRTDDRDRIVLEGEDVAITTRIALTLALVVHELTTNAVKYGGLSVPAGRVFVRWTVDSAAPPPVLQIDWREEGGPPVVVPSAFRFGSRFIEGSVRSELRGEAKSTFDPAGLRCLLTIPLGS